MSPTNVSSSHLQQLVIEASTDLIQSNVDIHAVIFDQGSTNRSMASKFNITFENPFIDLQINSSTHRIFFIYDVVHIMKAFHNNLLKTDLKFEYNNLKYVASWNHIKSTFIEEKDKEVNMIPKIKSTHIYSSNFEKMKVKLAVQVFSNTFASAMNVLIDESKLPKEAEGTRILIKLLSDLFDVLKNNQCNEDNYLKPDSSSQRQLKNYLSIFALMHKSVKKVFCLVITFRGPYNKKSKQKHVCLLQNVCLF